jgi:hypothetical protein
VPEGTHELRGERVGHAPQTGVVALTADAVLETDFGLTPATSPQERFVPGDQPNIHIDGARWSPSPLDVLDRLSPSETQTVEVAQGPAATGLFGPDAAEGTIGDAEDPVTMHVKNNNFHDATLWLVSRGGRVHLGTVTGKTEASFTTPVTSPADVWRVEIDLVGGEWCQTRALTVDPGDVLDLLVAVDVTNMPECYPAGRRPGD